MRTRRVCASRLVFPLCILGVETGPGDEAGRVVEPVNERLEEARRQALAFGRAGAWGLDALEANSNILRQAPEDFGALYRRGRCHEEQDDFPAAKEDYARALRIRPGTGYVEEALARIERGWEGAEERAEKARERRRAQVAERAREAQVRAEKDQARRRAREARRRAEKARAEDFRRIEAISDFEEAYRFGIAASKGDHPDYPLAIAALRRAWKLDPSRRRLPVLTRLAGAYRKIGRADLARKTYEWVLARDDNRYSRVGLAAVYEDLGRHDDALDQYGAVLALDPGDSYALRGVARTLASLGRTDEAIEAYQKAVQAGGNDAERSEAISELRRMRDQARLEGDVGHAEWIDSVVWRIRKV